MALLFALSTGTSTNDFLTVSKNVAIFAVDVDYLKDENNLKNENDLRDENDCACRCFLWSCRIIDDVDEGSSLSGV